MPLALGDQLATAESSAAGKDLVEGGFFARIIRCLMGEGREKQGATSMSQRAPAEVSTLAQGKSPREEACLVVTGSAHFSHLLSVTLERS